MAMAMPPTLAQGGMNPTLTPAAMASVAGRKRHPRRRRGRGKRAKRY